MLSSAVEDSVGFEHVDAHVTNVMIAWIGGVVEQTCRELLAFQHLATSCNFQVLENTIQIDSDAIFYVHSTIGPAFDMLNLRFA